MLAWVDKFEASLGDAHGSVEDHRAGLRWLRRLISGEDPKYASGPSVDAILDDLLRLGKGERVEPSDGSTSLPSDQIVQLFPGADVPHLAPDLLMSVGSTKREDSISAPGMMVVTKPMGAKCFDQPMLFCMGALLPGKGGDGTTILVSWYLPHLVSATSFKGGRKKKA